MINKKHKKWKNIHISRQLRDIIHGYIMSDGYISRNGVLYIEQSKQQALFVQWLYRKFQMIRTNTPIRKLVRIDKRSGQKTFSYRFNTRCVCQGFRSMWYKKIQCKYKKCLPKSIDCFFSIPFITLWFAGDGTKMIGQRGCKIEVTCYTPKERLKLKKLFKSKFNISTKILRAGKSRTGTPKWTLSLCASEYEKFRILVTQMDLIPALFPHKLCKFDPVTTLYAERVNKIIILPYV